MDPADGVAFVTAPGQASLAGRCPAGAACTGAGSVHRLDATCACPAGAFGATAGATAAVASADPSCYDPAWLCGPACSGFGNCTTAPAAGCACDCTDRRCFAGAVCDHCAPGYTDYPRCVEISCFPDPCAGHGFCSAGSCACGLGYTGPGCSRCAVGFIGYPNCVDDPVSGRRHSSPHLILMTHLSGAINCRLTVASFVRRCSATQTHATAMEAAPAGPAPVGTHSPAPAVTHARRCESLHCAGPHAVRLLSGCVDFCHGARCQQTHRLWWLGLSFGGPFSGRRTDRPSRLP